MNPLMKSISNNSTYSISNFSQLANISRMLRSSNPNQIAQELMKNNAQFKAFMDMNKGKTPEQFAQEHGIDVKQIMEMMK